MMVPIAFPSTGQEDETRSQYLFHHVENEYRSRARAEDAPCVAHCSHRLQCDRQACPAQEGHRRHHVVIPVAAKSRYTAMIEDPNLLKHRLVCRESKDWLIVSCKPPESIQRTRARSHRPAQAIVDPKLEASLCPELATSFRELTFGRTSGHQRGQRPTPPSGQQRSITSRTSKIS